MIFFCDLICFFEGMLLTMMTYSFLFYLTTTNIMQSLFVFIGPASINSFFPSRSNRVPGPSLGKIQARLQKNRNQSAQLGPWSDHFIVSKYLCLVFSEIIFYILSPKNANMNVLETLFSSHLSKVLIHVFEIHFHMLPLTRVYMIFYK